MDFEYNEEVAKKWLNDMLGRMEEGEGSIQPVKEKERTPVKQKPAKRGRKKAAEEPEYTGPIEEDDNEPELEDDWSCLFNKHTTGASPSSDAFPPPPSSTAPPAPRNPPWDALAFF